MDNNEIAVSIIVPVYNVERFIERCIKSILSQELRNIEVILVDDGSTDSSGQICDLYAAKDERIRVIHKKNAGLGYARNSGLEIAIGEFVGFVDSDDFISINMYNNLYRLAVQYNADYVRCESTEVDESGNNLERDSCFKLREGIYDKQEMREKLFYPMFGKDLNEGKEGYIGVSVWRAIYRRSIIENHNIRFCSERDIVSEDIPFNLDFMVWANRAYVSNEILHYYVMREGSLTKAFRTDRFEKIIELYQLLQTKLEKYEIYDACEIRIKRLLMDRCRGCISGVLRNNEYSKKEKREAVGDMLNNTNLDDIFVGFPINKLPWKYRVIAYMMKYKMTRLLMFVL